METGTNSLTINLRVSGLHVFPSLAQLQHMAGFGLNCCSLPVRRVFTGRALCNQQEEIQAP